MALPRFFVRCGLSRSPEMHELARALGVNRETAVCRIVDLYDQVMCLRENGSLAYMDEHQIAQMATWTGDHYFFVRVLAEQGWLDKDREGHFVVSGWMKDQGSLVRDREYERNRRKASGGKNGGFSGGKNGGDDDVSEKTGGKTAGKPGGENAGPAEKTAGFAAEKTAVAECDKPKPVYENGRAGAHTGGKNGVLTGAPLLKDRPGQERTGKDCLEEGGRGEEPAAGEFSRAVIETEQRVFDLGVRAPTRPTRLTFLADLERQNPAHLAAFVAAIEADPKADFVATCSAIKARAAPARASPGARKIQPFPEL